MTLPEIDRFVRPLAVAGSRRVLLARLVSAAIGGTAATAGRTSTAFDPNGGKGPKGHNGGGGHGRDRVGGARGAGATTRQAVPMPTGAPTPSDWQAALRAGSCADLGPATAALQPPLIPTGPVQGAPAAILGATSFTPAPRPLATLVATPHVLTLARADTLVACGAIGGVLAPDGSLTIVLRAQPGSLVTGLAFIAASGNISLFVDPGPRAAATPTPMLAPAPTGVATLPTVAPSPIG